MQGDKKEKTYKATKTGFHLGKHHLTQQNPRPVIAKLRRAPTHASRPRSYARENTGTMKKLATPISAGDA